MFRIQNIVDLIFPTRCLGCGVSEQGIVCPKCWAKIEVGPRKYTGYQGIDKIIVAVERSKLIRQMITRFKYRQLELLGDKLGKLALEALRKQGVDSRQVVIVPVPLYRWRRWIRGFNQAEQIGEYLVKEGGYQMRSGFLRRTRSTRTQVGLSREERLNNLSGAFAASEKVKDQRILLLDDVLTTGATLEECAKVLHENGVASVSALVISHGTVG